MKGIRGPLDSLPTHITETSFINELITCVVLMRIGESDPEEHIVFSDQNLAKWEATHRPKLFRCSRWLRMSIEDLMNGADTPHESAIASLDAFVQTIRQGTAEGDPVKYVTDQTIADARQARNQIQSCETRLICY